MVTLSTSRFDYTFEDYRRYLRQKSPGDQLSRMQEVLESCITSDDAGETFLLLVDDFIRNGGNPNLTFPEFAIWDNSFRNVTCFQLVYLYWKNPDPLKGWNREINARFQQLVDSMLNDERTDVRAKFTEDSLCDSEHFFNEKLEAYPRQREEEGYLLERVTIAHYAMTINDFEMVDKVLQKAPDLLHSTCCLMKGKNLLHHEVLSVAPFLRNKKEFTCLDDDELDSAMERGLDLDEMERVLELDDDEVSGEIARATISLKSTEGMTYPVTRITKVSLMHLAARLGDEVACGYFRGRQANFVARDSDDLTPFDYLNLSLSEGFITELPSSKRLFKVLEPITRLNKPCLPNSNLLLRREGYQLIYDTRTRVAIYAYERLTKKSLIKNSERAVGGSFKIDREIPKQNRGTSTDYNNSGFDKGHLVPAANAVFSDKAMEDTFIFTNACPQNPELNQQYWKGFEKHIRDLTASHDLIEVFTGCLFVADDNKVNYQTIGKGQISVPTHLFKVLYLYKGLNKDEKAYILPNGPIHAEIPYSDFLCSVDKVQRLSGILFSEWRPSLS